MEEIKFKEHYTLEGCDGNAYAVMGRVINAMKDSACSPDDIKQYQKDAMSSTYEHLLAVSFRYIDTLNKKLEK